MSCALLPTAWTPVLSAQQVNLELFRPSTHENGLISVESAQVATEPSIASDISDDFGAGDSGPGADRQGAPRGLTPHALTLRASLWLDYAARSLVLLRSDLPGPTAVIAHRASAQIGISASILNRLALGLTLPATLAQAGETTPLTRILGGLATSALSDFRISAKLSLLDQQRFAVDAAVFGELMLPTATARGFAGDEAVSGAALALLERRFGAVRLLGNIGVRFRPRRELVDWVSEHQLDLRAGVGFNLQRFGLELPVELMGEVLSRAAVDAPFARMVQTPVEFDAGVKWMPSPSWEINGGLGTRMSGGVGAPAFRVFFGIAFLPFNQQPPAPTSIPASAPAPVMILEASSEPVSLPVANPDRDGDGLLNDVDSCADAAEDRDGFADGDGCPDLDNDGDGIADTADRCPNEAEVINGVEDDDGCPDDGPSLVVVTKEKIEIRDKVYFDTGRATLQARSSAVLDQVAAVLRNYEAVRVQVEGHTDDVGPAERNLALSQARAEAVCDYLIQKGVSRNRLTPVGFGETKPLTPNLSQRGRDTNRRVEFTLLPALSDAEPQETAP